MLQLDKADAIRTLEKIVWDGAVKRLGTELTVEQKERINQELETIREYGSGKYFLIMWETIRMLKEVEVPICCSGCCAGSAVCYCLGITHIDPIKYGLRFNEFANPKIFLHIAPCSKDLLMEFLTEKYGRQHVARIGFKDKVLKGTLVLSADKLTDAFPVKTVIDPDTGKGTIAVLCTREEAIKMGLYIIPYNGFYALEINSFTLDRIKQFYGISINIDRIVLDDKATLRLFGEGKTRAVPYLDSPMLKDILKNKKPKSFDEIVETIQMEFCWPRAYAASKVFLSFQSAYLKAHYPAEYMTEAFRFFNSRGWKERAEEILEDCRRNGIAVKEEERNGLKFINIL